MKNALKNFFTFEKRGQKGLLILAILLIVQLIVLWALNFYNPIINSHPNLILVNPNLLDSLENNQNQNNTSKIAEAFNDDVVTFHSYKKEFQRFKFNPNTINDEQWLSLGLKKGQIKGIRKYIEKGGRFKKPEDVRKFKAVNQAMWAELIPYIVLDEVKPFEQKSIAFIKDTNNIAMAEKANEKAERQTAFKASLNFEFNTCTKYNLQQLDLLDSLTIDKLMRYKKGLGGFVSLSQLYEMEGVDTNNFRKLKSHLTLDLLSIKTININTCAVSQLSKHPYLSYNVATALVNYRNAHGKYSAIADLKKCLAMNDNLLKKITPYLRLNDE